MAAAAVAEHLIFSVVFSADLVASAAVEEVVADSRSFLPFLKLKFQSLTFRFNRQPYPVLAQALLRRLRVAQVAHPVAHQAQDLAQIKTHQLEHG